MAIVVSVFMLLGFLMASPWVPPGLRVLRSKSRVVDVLASGLLIAGLWNSLWHGLRHLADFWGQAALVSGFLMIAVAILLLVEHGGDSWRRQPAAVRAHAALKPLATVLVVGLALCFGLYAVALVRLNLGLPIPG
jgi:hypothetical protein